ncbi:hypothetical protein LXA43DRAFT_927635 [Ganoderma leucocontextum]|nr:hypothetical protein LXA43DRAFT_927635 [Ganoderma leucocontextum]
MPRVRQRLNFNVHNSKGSLFHTAFQLSLSPSNLAPTMPDPSRTSFKSRSNMTQDSTMDTLPFPDFAPSMPAVDRASLDGLSKDEIRAWALRKSEEYRLLSHTMLSLHNAVAPIHALPTEVLMKIFGQTWDRRHARCSLALPSVCRRWRTVYLSTPEFWAAVVSNLRFIEHPHDHDDESWFLDYRTRFPNELVATLLDRSSPRPIKLDLKMDQTSRPDSALPSGALPPLLFPHFTRAVSLYLCAPLLDIPNLFQVLGAGMPSLEVLMVDPGDSEMRPEDLARTLTFPPVLDDRLPRLRELYLGPSALFPLIAVKSLKKVYLNCGGDGLRVDAEGTPLAALDSRALLQGLKRCRDLEMLYFAEWTIPRWWPSPNDVGTLQLPSMKELCIAPAWQSSILSAVGVLDPCLPSTALVTMNNYTNSNIGLNDFFDILPIHLIQHHAVDSVAIFVPNRWHHPNYWWLRCFSSNALRLEVTSYSSRRLGNLGLGDVAGTLCITRLAVIQEGDIGTASPADDWTAFLCGFPHLNHLTVIGRDIPTHALEALGPRAVTDVMDPAPPSCTTPICPGLRYVTLGWEMPQAEEFVDSDGPDSATHRPQDLDAHVERRCSMMQEIFKRRRKLGAGGLDALEFYDYESDDELITSSRQDSDTRDLPCLAELRDVTGGRVIYRGYLFNVLSSVSESLPMYWDNSF